MSTDHSNEILDDYSPLLIRYNDGRIERLMDTPFTPPSLDLETSVQSKDVIISPEINLSARIFLPNTITPARKLPLLVFFHGGAFIIESAFSLLYTRYLNLLTSEANVIAVSVDYRLAPEHPLPIAFDDSWTAVNWIFNEARNQDSWIQHFADFDRVYFGGDSAGGTIAHNMAMRFKDGMLSGVVNLRGMFLNSPYFLGEERIGKEEELYKVPSKFYPDDLWRYACPGSSGCDDPLINPGKNTEVSKLGCKRVLVYNGNDDFLKDRGVYYKQVLEKSEWNGDVEVLGFDGEGHIFDVINPTGKNSVAILKKVSQFLNM